MARKSSKEPAEHGFTLISREKLLSLYAGLIQCRMLDEALSGSPRHKPGREAPAVAVAIDLLAADSLVAASHDPLPGFIKARKRDEAMAGLRKPSGEKVLSTAALLKSAVAAARQHQREQKQNIVAVFAAAAWTKSAPWRAALLAARDERLPMVFVAPGPAIAKGVKLGFPSIPVDRDDVVALFRVASESIAHARRGNGATLIECVAWEPPGAEKGSSAAGHADAILNMESYLAQARIPGGRTKARVTSIFKRRLRVAATSSSNFHDQDSAGGEHLAATAG
jgi:hypothetical protein